MLYGPIAPNNVHNYILISVGIFLNWELVLINVLHGSILMLLESIVVAKAAVGFCMYLERLLLAYA